MRLVSNSLLALSFLLPLAHGEIIGVEQFDYPDGPIAAKNGGTFWNWRNRTPAARTAGISDWDNIHNAPGVASGRLVTGGAGQNAVIREYNGPGEGATADIDRDDGLGAINNFIGGISFQEKKVYYRVTVTTGATLPDYFGLSSHDFGTERLFFGKRGGSPTFGLESVGGGGTNGTRTIDPSTTYTLVVRIDYVAGTIALFVDPDINVDETSQFSISRTFDTTFWSTAVRLAAGGGGDPVQWDNLVVATTWEDLGTVVTIAADEDNGSLDPAAGGGTGVSLREAVKYSPSGTLITFAPGLSGQTITLTHAEGDMLIPAAVTIDATALPGGLTVDGNNTSRHFNVESGKSLTLRGLTVTRGNGTGGFETGGGAIVNDGTLTLDRCIIIGNASSDAAGAILSAGTLRATDSTISENRAISNGAGVLVFSGTAELSRCTLSGNTAGSGGALWLQGSSTASLSHCTVAGNRSTSGSSVGGIGVFAGTLNLQHCTISQNTGGGGCGGLYLQSPATVNVANCIIAGNSDPGSNRADIFFFNNGPTLTPAGTNLIGNNESVATQFPTGPLVGTAAAPLDPKLSALGSFGGPVQTMHPLIGSPAIDAAGTADPGGTDARGFPRVVDGDASAGAQLDIGSLEAGPLRTVTSLVDGNNGALRNAISLSVAPGARIGFSSTFDNAAIPYALFNGQLSIPANRSLFIDASNIAGGVTISGNNNYRVFNIPATATLAMHSLKIVDGRSPNFENGGGGIFNNGSCTVLSSTLSGNSTATDKGGGIFNSGTCGVVSSTLSGNSANIGGGIYNNGTCTVLSSTLSGNFAGLSGGGIYNVGRCSVLSSTISGNSATSFGEGGGGIYNSNAAPFSIISNIVAGNTAPVDPDIDGSLTPGSSNNLIGGAPLLAPLGDYGGPTQTMPPLPGSPAIDEATASTRTTDQRGFPTVGFPDIGAAEYQGNTDLRLFWNTDWDGDGNAFGLEFALGSNPTLSDPNHPKNLRFTRESNGHYRLEFGHIRTTVNSPATTIVTRSTTLLPGSFTEIFRYIGPTDYGDFQDGTTGDIREDNIIEVIDGNPPPGKAFYRLEAVSP